jgi:tetratricopeptide (TPR) repeat protein
MFYINYAWKARGGGWASSVVEDGQELFRKRLSIAREYLEKAYTLDTSDPIVPASLITVSRGLGLDHEQMELQFQRGINADNTAFRPYRAKLVYLMPKWHGSKEEMFEFARDIAHNAPRNSLAPQILAQAHWEMYYRADDKKSYFRDPNVWEEAKNVYYQLLEYFPDSKEIHNWLARMAYLAGDYETARKEFEYIKEDMLESCWRNMKFFEKAKKEVLESAEVS